MSDIYKNSKCYRIAEELLSEILSGTLKNSSRFYTRNEVAEKYAIGLITVAKVFHILETQGHIKQSPRLRPEILRRESAAYPEASPDTRTSTFCEETARSFWPSHEDASGLAPNPAVCAEESVSASPEDHSAADDNTDSSGKAFPPSEKRPEAFSFSRERTDGESPPPALSRTERYAFLMPEPVFLNPGRWTLATMNKIRNLLDSRGIACDLRSTDGRNIAALSAEYSAFIMLEPIDSFPAIEEALIASGKPYVIFSGVHLRPNALFFDPAYILQELFLKIIKLRIRHMVTISAGHIPAADFDRFHRAYMLRNLSDFYNYQMKTDAYYYTDSPQGNLAFFERIFRSVSSTDPVLFITSNDYLANLLFQYLALIQTRDKYRNCRILAYNAEAPASECAYSYINFKSGESAEAMLEILDNQIQTGTTFDPGKILLPENVFLW